MAKKTGTTKNARRKQSIAAAEAIKPKQPLAQPTANLSAEDGATFIFFQQLPIELRFKVWEEALTEPQLIEMPLVCKKMAVNARSPNALLQTCRESRTEALKIYTAALYEGPLIRRSIARYRYSPLQDTIVFTTSCRHRRHRCISNRLSSKALDQILNIGIHIRAWEVPDVPTHSSCIRDIRHIRNLQIVHYIVHSNNCDRAGSILTVGHNKEPRGEISNASGDELAVLQKLENDGERVLQRVKTFYQNTLPSRLEIWPLDFAPKFMFATWQRGGVRCCRLT